MDFQDVVQKRFSCKSFDGRVVEARKLNAILEMGRLAPTAKNLQEHHIYVVQKKELLEKIDKATPCRYNAGTVLVITFDKNNVYTYPGNSARTSGIEDATIVATHLILAAANEGVDSCWVNCVKLEVLAKELNLPDSEEILMVMDLGYATKEGVPLANHYSRKPLSETVTFW